MGAKTGFLRQQQEDFRGNEGAYLQAWDRLRPKATNRPMRLLPRHLHNPLDVADLLRPAEHHL
jgi:hypothetical protein